MRSIARGEDETGVERPNMSRIFNQELPSLLTFASSFPDFVSLFSFLPSPSKVEKIRSLLGYCGSTGVPQIRTNAPFVKQIETQQPRKTYVSH